MFLSKKNVICYTPDKPLSAKNSAPLVWFIAPMVIIMFYNLYTFNRFLPLTEGWFSSYAELILEGKIPYRDFYLFLPPLYPLTIAGLMTIFGKQLLVLRIFGIGLIMIMTGTLYAVLARFFKHGIAAIVTVLAMIYYQSGVAHITYDFIQFVTTYALLSVYFFIKYYDACVYSDKCTSHWTKNESYLLLSGLFSALTFWTKQSNGSVIFTFIAIGVVLATLPISKRWMYKSGIGFSLGAALPTLLILFWLLRHNAIGDFWQQIAVGAVNSKGSLYVIFFSWINNLFCKHYFVQLLKIVALLLCIGYCHLLIRKQDYDLFKTKNEHQTLIGLFFVIVFALILPLVSPSSVHKTKVIGQLVINNIIVLSTATAILLVLKYLFNPKKNTPDVILSMLSLGYIFGCGTSAGITEAGAFMGFALFLCHIFSAKHFFHTGKFVIFGLSLCMIVFFAQRKYTEPYAWWYIKTPQINQATHASHLPLLKGFYLPETTIAILETVDKIVQQSTTQQDAILTFPNIPLFYLIENRMRNIKAVVHWPDFLPDNFARLEAKKIRSELPKVIIYLTLPEVVWSTHERLFRNGQQSGQRDIIEAIKSLTTENKLYELQAKLPVSEEVSLYVWVKNKRPSPNKNLDENDA